VVFLLNPEAIITKILIIHPHIFTGGAERLLLYLAKHLEEKHEIGICTLSLEENLPDFCKRLNFIVPKKMRRFGFIDERVQRYFYTINTTRELRKLVNMSCSTHIIFLPR
jgi:hypothetical protein